MVLGLFVFGVPLLGWFKGKLKGPPPPPSPLGGALEKTHPFRWAVVDINEDVDYTFGQVSFVESKAGPAKPRSRKCTPWRLTMVATADAWLDID